MSPGAGRPPGLASVPGTGPSTAHGLLRWRGQAAGGAADALALGLSIAFAAAAAFHPFLTLGLGITALLFAGFWKHPYAIVLVLVALMTNIKFNIYLGLLTVFPEYVPLLIMSAIVALRWSTGGMRIEERRLLLLFGLFFLVGCLSIVNAINPARVLSKAMLIPVAALVTYLVATLVRSEGELGRALRWLEISAFVVALYGIAQIVGLFMHWDMGLRFLHRWGNPDFEYAVGAPVVSRGVYVFRANSLFNDPNILGGYLAAAFATVLALRLHHGEQSKDRRRAQLETALLGVLLLCQMFTMSRSGMLGTMAGALVVLRFNPRVARSPRLWVTLGAGLSAVLALATLAGVNPGLLAWRLASSFDPGDLSSTTHLSVALYGLSLIARYPLTGVGLRNFGYYYASEVNVRSPGMMSHNAVLSYFAETGLLGGILFLALLFAIGMRPWRAVRSPAAATASPALRAATVGLLGALVALLISNLFYDFSLRTFVWVFAGLAIAAARLHEQAGSGERASPGNLGPSPAR